MPGKLMKIYFPLGEQLYISGMAGYILHMFWTLYGFVSYISINVTDISLERCREYISINVLGNIFGIFLSIHWEKLLDKCNLVVTSCPLYISVPFAIFWNPGLVVSINLWEKMMKIYTINFCNDNCMNQDSITVSTLKEINFPSGNFLIDSDLEVIVRKFLEDCFDEYLKQYCDDDLVFHHFGEIESVYVFEIKYPLI
jgi:hypothetical protein